MTCLIQQSEYYASILNKTILEYISKASNLQKEEEKETSMAKRVRRDVKIQHISPTRQPSNLEVESLVSPHLPQPPTIMFNKTSQLHVSLHNIIMQARKASNHPYLIKRPCDEIVSTRLPHISVYTYINNNSNR
jgi:hypothetical protein